MALVATVDHEVLPGIELAQVDTPFFVTASGLERGFLAFSGGSAAHGRVSADGQFVDLTFMEYSYDDFSLVGTETFRAEAGADLEDLEVRYLVVGFFRGLQWLLVQFQHTELNNVIVREMFLIGFSDDGSEVRRVAISDSVPTSTFMPYRPKLDTNTGNVLLCQIFSPISYLIDGSTGEVLQTIAVNFIRAAIAGEWVFLPPISLGGPEFAEALTNNNSLTVEYQAYLLSDLSAAPVTIGGEFVFELDADDPFTRDEITSVQRPIWESNDDNSIQMTVNLTLSRSLSDRTHFVYGAVFDIETLEHVRAFLIQVPQGSPSSVSDNQGFTAIPFDPMPVEILALNITDSVGFQVHDPADPSVGRYVIVMRFAPITDGVLTFDDPIDLVDFGALGAVVTKQDGTEMSARRIITADPALERSLDEVLGTQDLIGDPLPPGLELSTLLNAEGVIRTVPTEQNLGVWVLWPEVATVTDQPATARGYWMPYEGVR